MCYRIIHHLHTLCGNICSEMYTVSDDFGVKMPELDFTPHVNTVGIDAHEYRPILTPPLCLIL